MKPLASRVSTTVVVLTLFAASFPAGPARGAGATAADPPSQEAREVRTTWTAEYGLPRPTGLTFSPAEGELLVAGSDKGETSILRMTPAEDVRGSLPPLPTSSLGTLAADPATGRLSVLDRSDLVSMAVADRAVAGGQVERSSIASLGFEHPVSATYGPDGMWFVLDGPAIIAVSAGPAGVPTVATRITLHRLGAARLRGLAYNADDGLLYVASPDEDRLYGLDLTGNVRKTYGLGQVGLMDLSAITFAPSADATDDPSTTHLYIADAGSASRLGGVVEVTLEAAVTLAATTVTPTLVQVIATSAWSPGSPDPAGVTYLPGADRLMVADSEVDEVTGAGYHGVNLWKTTRSGTVTDTGTTFPAFSKEPTGLGYIPGSNTLLISDDSNKKIWLVRPGGDQRFGTGDDVVSSIDALAYGSSDTEDPTFDATTGNPTSGHIFFVDGKNTEVYDVNPIDGVFGNGNDVMTHFDVGQFGPSDWEGLVADTANDTLLVGARGQRKIYETTKAGALVRIIDLSGIASVRMISGLALAPASDGSGVMNIWIVDRGVDNGTDANENDGRLIEVTLGGSPPPNLAPTAIGDSYAATEDTMRTVAAPGVLANDSDPELGALTAVLASGPTRGTLTLNSNGSFSYVPNANFNGADSFTYRARDPLLAVSAPVTVTLNVAAVNDPPVVTDPGDRSSSEGATVSLQVVATDVDGDTLDYSAQNLPPGLSIAPATGLISGIIDAGAETGSPYAVEVTADDGNGANDSASFSWSVIDLSGPPAVPTGLTAGVTSLAVELDWADNNEPDLAGYDVWRAVAPGGTFVRLNASPLKISAYADASAVLGQAYDYQVVAVDTLSLESGPASVNAIRRIGSVGTSGAALKRSSSLTIALPPNVQDGDVMLAGVAVKGSVTISAPSGWTQVASNVSGTSITQVVYARVAATGDVGWTWTLSSAKHVAGAISAYRGAALPIGPMAGQGNSSSTLVRAPSVTGTADALLVGFFGTAANTSIAPDPAMREAIEVRGANSTALAIEVADDVLAAGGPTGIRTAVAGQAARNIGQVVVLLP